jgi:phospholipid-binding lipoprotein MlaA
MMTVFRSRAMVLRPVMLSLLGVLLGACSTKPVKVGEPVEVPVFPADQVLNQEGNDTVAGRIWDPLEGMNRTFYRFNYYFDRYVFLPGVAAYQYVTPDPVEKGLHNFFNNLSDITTLINSALQLNLEKTMNSLTRVSVNSTIGLLGFLDIASDVPKRQEDFGQTLGYWGVGDGPYLVIPVLGPSNFRDGAGYAVDQTIRSELWSATNIETYQEWIINILWSLDQRAHIDFRYYETGSPFEYELVRTLYTTKRQLDIER